MGKRKDDETPKTKWDVIWIVLSNPKIITILIAFSGLSTAYHIEPVRQYLPDFTGEVGDPVSTDIHPEVRAKLERLIEITNQHTSSIGSLKNKYKKSDGTLQEQIDVNRELIRKWHRE
jgi:hypothetical protein